MSSDSYSVHDRLNGDMKRCYLIAVQEINDDYRKFVDIVKQMGRDFDFIMSDSAGNDERLA